MSNEIATYSMIKSKTTLGSDGTECPTKTVIKAISSYIIINNESSYGANECVKIDDIDAIRYTFRYYNHIGDPEWNVAAGGNQLFVTVESCRIDGNNRINVPFKFKQLPDWLSNSSIEVKDSADNLYYLVLTASANFSTSSRSGTVIIEQEESNLTLTYSVKQSGDSISTYGDWEVSVSASPTTISSDGGTSTITASATRTVYWASGDVTEETGNPTLSTNLGSLSSTSSPSTLTLGENTSTSSRTATIKATHGGKSATCTVTQAGAEPTIEYVFTISPWQVNVGASGGTGDIGFTSYKLVNGNQISLGYSIDSSTLPSWATYSNGRFTISSNSSTSSRSANVYFQQEESGKRDYATISQSGYVPPADNYVFTWDDGSTSSKSESFQATDAVSAAITLVSTKNGSNHPWSVSSKPSWITTSTTSSKVTISASDNSGSARSGEVVLTQSGSGKTLTVNVSQAAYSATVEWRYKFGFSNGAMDNISIAIRNMKEYDGASVTFASYKSKYVDGVEDVSSRQYVDFSIGDYASWATVTKVSSSIANEGKFKFTLSSNFNNRSNRQTSVTVTQNESNKSIICDIMQVGSDAFVATYYSHVRGSDTYPDEISFGIVTTPTTKQYEWESTFEVHTVDSDYDAYTYNYGAISEVKKVTVNASMNTTWFGYEYIQDGGSYQYDLLKVNAPKSDGINHHEKLYILQLVTSAPSTSFNYREITNTPIAAEILVTQKGNIIS